MRISVSRGVLVVAAMAISLAMVPNSASAAFRCGNKLIDQGMLAIKVEALCGEPTFRDSRILANHLTLAADEEDWVYDFGSSRLLQVITFRKGRVSRIRTEGYGVSNAERGQCSTNRIVEGMSKYRLFSLCGAPDQSNANTVYLPYRRKGVVLGHRQVFREEWIYNFGNSKFLRHVILNNGYVVEVETGERGF